ncbi:xanthine phosphoribosyltransferase [Butyrivibrio sp. NC3005]|uniref:xanthine phosphoribosyltransferase n=1 Tax=Butyrivibrio sp. NC3005 TaxID=1280685 RepID=UPI000416983F|nr:xanthine phosphoribosyltransferase [Butyrivibrio sp. NC3005]
MLETLNFLEERIEQDGQVRAGNILKVDSFLNHQLDVVLLDQIGKTFYEKYKNQNITRVLTVEASGIAIACMTAQYFGVPVVFAKKAKSKNLDGDLYVSTVHSFTYDRDYEVTLSKKFLSNKDKVLLVDDFLAVGKAMNGLLDICNQAGATVAGIGIAIEKGFQGGGDKLRSEGKSVTSIAIIDEMTEDGIKFRKQEDLIIPTFYEKVI